MSVAVTTSRPPFWRDVRVLRLAVQAAVVVVVVAFGAWLAGNVRENSEALGIPLTFDYLDEPSNITIPGSEYRATQSVLDAVLVGLANTLRVAITGVVLATILGVAIGIARLSTNWLVRTAARAYVEAIRNIPLLVVVIFTYLAVFLRLPRVDDATEVSGILVLTVRGVVVPWFAGNGWWLVAMVGAGAVAAAVVVRWRRALFDRSGTPSHGFSFGLAAFLAAAVVTYVAAGAPLSFTVPDREGRSITGGITMAPEYTALLVALVVYTASHIAEIVRGSIQAVPRGQSEAASALALSSGQRMRLVVLPQAMRIAVPAMGNQYLNLTKNSSLAVAISYFELTKITQLTIGNQAPAVPSYGLLLFTYLMISLALSGLTNIVNRRLALVER